MADPWDANTLEWTTTSPPGQKNFDRVIPVRSTRPFRDYKRPEDADWNRPEGARAREVNDVTQNDPHGK